MDAGDVAAAEPPLASVSSGVPPLVIAIETCVDCSAVDVFTVNVLVAVAFFHSTTPVWLVETPCGTLARIAHPDELVDTVVVAVSQANATSSSSPTTIDAGSVIACVVESVDWSP